MALIKISELPLDIQKEIPMSIRTFRDEYELSDLPNDIQFLIEDYLIHKKNVEYNLVLDATPYISPYGDFIVIDNIHTLVLEYLKQYLQIQPNDFPFDPLFGSSLKTHLQKRDTKLRQILVNNEIKNITKVIATDLNINIKISNLKIQKSSGNSIDVIYTIILKILINNVEKQMVLEIS